MKSKAESWEDEDRNTLESVFLREECEKQHPLMIKFSRGVSHWYHLPLQITHGLNKTTQVYIRVLSSDYSGEIAYSL